MASQTCASLSTRPVITSRTRPAFRVAPRVNQTIQYPPESRNSRLPSSRESAICGTASLL